jgi:hypothetical protein
MLHYNDSSKRIDVKKNNEESGDNWQRRNAPRTHVMSPCRNYPTISTHSKFIINCILLKIHHNLFRQSPVHTPVMQRAFASRH